MAGFTFKKEISVMNIVTIMGLIIGFVVAFSTLEGDVQAAIDAGNIHSEAIEKLENKTENYGTLEYKVDRALLSLDRIERKLDE